MKEKKTLANMGYGKWYVMKKGNQSYLDMMTKLRIEGFISVEKYSLGEYKCTKTFLSNDENFFVEEVDSNNSYYHWIKMFDPHSPSRKLYFVNGNRYIDVFKFENENFYTVRTNIMDVKRNRTKSFITSNYEQMCNMIKELMKENNSKN